MAQSIWRRVLLQGIGLLAYLGGMLLFLVVGLDVYLSEPERSLENLGNEHMIFIGVSLVLIMIGGGLMQKFGRGIAGFGGLTGGLMMGGAQSPSEPEQSSLEQLGYQIPEETDETTPEPRDGGVTCPSCGASNEPGYRFCAQCSSELSG